MTTININSESHCRKAYLNYHCYGNTMNISDEDMGRIAAVWSNKISSWQASVSSDENEYEFDDSDYSSYMKQGKEAGVKATGFNGNPTGQAIRTGNNLAATTASTTLSIINGGYAAVGKGVGSIVKKGFESVKGWFGKAGGAAAKEGAGEVVKEGAGEVVKEGAGEVVKEGAEEVVKEGAEEATKEAGKEVAKENISAYIGAALAIFTAAQYWIKAPNKEAKLACDALQTEMAAAGVTLTDNQADMVAWGEELMATSDQANAENNAANEEIQDQKTEYDMYLKTMQAIKAKAEAGEPLTDSEKELYKEVIGYLSEIGLNIEETADETSAKVSDLYDDMGTYQSNYENVAESMGEVQGLTDYAAGFDEATQTLCYVEGAAQTINVASGTAAGAKLLANPNPIPWVKAVDIAIAVLSFAAAASSGVAAGQQFNWAGEVGTEIKMRGDVQLTNEATMSQYEEEIDSFDGFMQGVEDLELEIPDETEAPTDTALPENENTNGSNGAGKPDQDIKPEDQSTGFADYTDILNDEVESSKVVMDPEGSGKVMVSTHYATAITRGLGLPASSSGGKFRQEAIPNIIANLMPGFDAEIIKKVMEGGSLDSSYEAHIEETLTRNTTEDIDVNNSATATQKLKKIIDFYHPILLKASQSGWKSV